MFCENITISWEPWSPCCWYSSISCRRDNWCFHSRTEIVKKIIHFKLFCKINLSHFLWEKETIIYRCLFDGTLSQVGATTDALRIVLPRRSCYTSRVFCKDRWMKECFKTKIATEEIFYRFLSHLILWKVVCCLFKHIIIAGRDKLQFRSYEVASPARMLWTEERLREPEWEPKWARLSQSESE